MNGVRTIPFNDSQMGIYLDCIDSKDSLKYNITFEYIFDLSTDVDRFKTARDKVFAHYGASRCGVDVIEGSPMLVVTDKTPKAGIIDVSEADYPEFKKHFAKPFTELASRYGVRSDIKYVYQGAMLQDLSSTSTRRKHLTTS